MTKTKTPARVVEYHGAKLTERKGRGYRWRFDFPDGRYGFAFTIEMARGMVDNLRAKKVSP